MKDTHCPYCKGRLIIPSWVICDKEGCLKEKESERYQRLKTVEKSNA